MVYREKFSLRQKKLRGELSDVFTYDVVPRTLRAQICHIWARCLGDSASGYGTINPAYIFLSQQIAEDIGQFAIGNASKRAQTVVFEFFTDEASDEEALDIIDLVFSSLADFHRRQMNWAMDYDVTEKPKTAIETLNKRFLEHRLGYAFVDSQLIRIDNEHLHKETVLPALRLLHEQGFEGANDEYRNAHEHYRKGNYKECLNDCLKAFESTLKTICAHKNWPHDPAKDTASQLIEVCVSNGLFPSFMNTQFGAIKSLLSSAVPVVRNKMGGHGQGVAAVSVPPYYAEFLLNETAACIVFVVKAYKG